MQREDFDGPEGGYIVVTWDSERKRWTFRPVMGGEVLSDGDVAALGLDAPLEGTGLQPPKVFGQRDARWGAVRLGASSYTMASAGCAVTSMAIAATALRPELTPLEMVNYLNANGGFTSGGLLYWAKAAQFVEGLAFVRYHLWRDVPADVALLRTALQNGPQVIQVDFHPATAALDSHFVCAVSFTDDGQDLNVIDPWQEKAGQLLKLYGKTGWTLGRAVYALAQLSYI